MRVPDEKVRKYATPLQAETCDALDTTGGDAQAAAALLGCSRDMVYKRLGLLRRRAAQRNVSDKPGVFLAEDATLEGYAVKGHTAGKFYEDADGTKRVLWTKTERSELERLALFTRAAEEMTADLRGRYEPIPAPDVSDEFADYLPVYPLGDHHLGMLAWAEETGSDYDVNIASRLLGGAVDRLTVLAPPSKQALLIVLGDFFHADSRNNRTELSGNALDVDGRFAKIARLGVELLRRTIDRMLTRHETVHVQIVGGNHDYHSAVWTRIALDAAYSNEPRCHIDPSPAHRFYFRFGNCLLGATHGHGPKIKDLPSIMADERAGDWGETTCRWFYTGHVHSQTLHNFRGCMVSTQEVLPPGDDWTTGKGYSSARGMSLDIYHRKWGYLRGPRVPVELIERNAEQ